MFSVSLEHDAERTTDPRLACSLVDHFLRASLEGKWKQGEMQTQAQVKLKEIGNDTLAEELLLYHMCVSVVSYAN